jgi:hypothetical protein
MYFSAGYLISNLNIVVLLFIFLALGFLFLESVRLKYEIVALEEIVKK